MKDNDVEIVLNQNTLDEYKRSNIDFRLRGGPSIDEVNSLSRRSQALQSVMNQNEDLMARLKLLTIRAGDLETQLEAREIEIRNLRKEREHLKEQTLILKEKETIFRERVQHDLQRGADLKEANHELIERLQKVERAFRRLFKYREKIRRALPQMKSMRKKSNRLTEVNGHLRTQVEDLSARLQKIHSEMSDAQSLLIADYESKIQAMENKMAELQSKASERDQYKQSQVEFENRNIELERELFHVKDAYSKESRALKSDTENFRRQTKELLVQCETLKSQIATKTTELDEQTLGASKLADQVESLQILWKEKQEDLERALEKNRSLQKLNQDISLKLNESKREVAELKQKLEAEAELLKRIRLASPK